MAKQALGRGLGALMGGISVDNQGRSNVHAHGTVALSDGSVRGGHWWEAHVSFIAEVFVTEDGAESVNNQPHELVVLDA